MLRLPQKKNTSLHKVHHFLIEKCAVWNTWGPVASSVQTAYKWTDSTVAMMANWGTIVFVLSAVPISWLMETRGLRWEIIVILGVL